MYYMTPLHSIQVFGVRVSPAVSSIATLTSLLTKEICIQRIIGSSLPVGRFGGLELEHVQNSEATPRRERFG